MALNVVVWWSCVVKTLDSVDLLGNHPPGEDVFRPSSTATKAIGVAIEDLLLRKLQHALARVGQVVHHFH